MMAGLFMAGFGPRACLRRRLVRETAAALSRFAEGQAAFPGTVNRRGAVGLGPSRSCRASISPRLSKKLRRYSIIVIERRGK
jgi:hypothetical protein